MMRHFIIIGITTLLIGCTPPQPAPSPSPSPGSPKPEISPHPNKGEPRTLKVSLTLGSPHDLKVSLGETITAGQILSDRSRERTRLAARLHQLRSQIQRLQIFKPQVSQPLPLPPVSYAEPEAGIRKAEMTLEEAQHQVQLQQQRLLAVGASSGDPSTEMVMAHEQVRLEQLQQQVDAAQIDLDLARAKLQTAKDARAFETYRRSLTLANQQLELAKAQQAQTTAIDALQTQITQVETELAQLAQVRSPWSATVKKLKWTGQQDQTLSVELTLNLATDPASSRSGSHKPIALPRL